MKHPLTSPLGRMGVDTYEQGAQRCVAAIPVARMSNPLTGLPTVAATAMLVDYICGLLNHRRHGPGEHTVSSELSLDLTPDAAVLIASDPELSVLATSRPLGAKNGSALTVCELTLGREVLGSASVWSVFIPTPAKDVSVWTGEAVAGERFESLAERMSIRVGKVVGSPVLFQTPDPALNNGMDVVHGGISAAALELVGSAALNIGRTDVPLNTASLRVNYLRPFVAGTESRYVGKPLHVGRRSGVSEAHAIDDNGQVALVARLTAYR